MTAGFHRVLGALSFPVAPDAEEREHCGPGCDCSACENDRAAAQSRYNVIRLDTFEGGPVELGSGILLAHPGGVTPTTTSQDMIEHNAKEAQGFISDALRLVALGRIDEARYELGQAARNLEQALEWCR
jgi:hypothetical protein